MFTSIHFYCDYIDTGTASLDNNNTNSVIETHERTTWTDVCKITL